jgi:hypothetical protein
MWHVWRTEEVNTEFWFGFVHFANRWLHVSTELQSQELQQPVQVHPKAAVLVTTSLQLLSSTADGSVIKPKHVATAS